MIMKKRIDLESAANRLMEGDDPLTIARDIGVNYHSLVTALRNAGYPPLREFWKYQKKYKANSADVEGIRKARWAGKNIKDISKEFGVSTVIVSKIVHDIPGKDIATQQRIADRERIATEEQAKAEAFKARFYAKD